jgi:diguanylate cyclase (GGDEF)-like protein/PAS domain S-box-containing protein
VRLKRVDTVVEENHQPSGLTESGVPSRDSPTTVSRFGALVACRFVALLFLAGLSGFGSDEAGPAVSILLVLDACVQPIVAAVAGRFGVVTGSFLAHDVALGAVVVLMAPSYFWLVAIGMVSMMAVQAVAAPLSRYIRISIAVPSLLAITGAATQTAYFERSVGLAAVLAVVFSVMGHQIRGSAESMRRDLNFAIDASGGYTHVTKLGVGLLDTWGDVEHVVGWPRREWMTMDQFRVVHPDDHDRFRVEAKDVAPGDVIDRMGRVRTKDGRWIWLHDVSRVVDAGSHLELHGFMMDVTAQQIGLDRVTAEATTDPLTGLANRRALIAELTDLADVGRHHLVLIDLNRFKEVNDTLGHEAGDALLRVVADRIAASISADEFLGRLGGDEFAIIYRKDVETAVVVTRLSTLAAELMRPVKINGVNVSTSISAGVVRANPSKSDRSTMLRHADMAMYSAKRGKVTAVVFDDQMGERLEQRLSLSNQVDDALPAGEIVLHFQPIVDARSGVITGAEGLVRWEHPRLGLLTPDAFLDVILLSERAGDFTRCMVEQAISAAAYFVSIGLSIPVSVNVPVRSIEDTDFEKWFVLACRSASVAHDRIVFEIAERDLHDGVATVEAVDRLSAIGVGIAVDGFGAGHATFDRLGWRNVNQIKLDRGITRTSATDERDGVIVRSIIDLAHALGYSVVAEGVEDIDQLEVLWEMGCEDVQGSLFSHPLPLTDFTELLRRRRLVPIAMVSALPASGF